MSMFIWVLILVFGLIIGNIMLIKYLMPKTKSADTQESQQHESQQENQQQNTLEDKSDASGSASTAKASGEEKRTSD